MEEDWTEHPEWLAKIDKVTQCGMKCAGPGVPGKDQGCSSPFGNRRLGAAEMDSFSNAMGTGTDMAIMQDLQ